MVYILCTPPLIFALCCSWVLVSSNARYDILEACHFRTPFFFRGALCPRKPYGLLETEDEWEREWEPRPTSLFTQLRSYETFPYSWLFAAWRPRRREGLAGTGTSGKRGTEEWHLKTGANPEDQGCRGPPPEQQDVKAVSARHCGATTAPRNCCPNC